MHYGEFLFAKLKFNTKDVLLSICTRFCQGLLNYYMAKILYNPAVNISR